MTHEHIVQDTDPHFTIDKTTREISIKSGTSNIMQFDHNSERLTFELPKKIDSHDMTACNVVEIHYINIDSSTKESNSDVYEVTDMAVSPDDESKAVLSWLISRNATKFAGALNFLIKFQCVAADGSVDYAWNTAVYKGLTVSNGMDNTGAVTDEYSDALAALIARVDEIGKNGVSSRPTKGVVEVELLATDWITEKDGKHYQTKDIAFATQTSQLEVTFDGEQLEVLQDKVMTFFAQYENGETRIYVLGDKPTKDYTVQLTIEEVVWLA